MSSVAWGTVPVICRFGPPSCNSTPWILLLRRVLLATIPDTGLLLAKDLLLEILVTQQAVRAITDRQALITRNFCAINILAQKDRSSSARGNGSLNILLHEKPLSRNDFSVRYKRYCGGEGKDNEFGNEHSDFQKDLRKRYQEPSIVMFTGSYGSAGAPRMKIESEDFQKWLDQPNIKKHNTWASLKQEPFTAKEFMIMFDRDNNGEVEKSEVVEVAVETVRAFRDMCNSIKGIERVAGGINKVFTCAMLCVIAVIYAAFFVKKISDFLAPIWATITGVSFALSGTVTEFMTAVIFVFSKQPYDVGDRVVIDGKELIVDTISLQYTVFHHCSDWAVEQIAHKKLCDSWITNLTRSNVLGVEEYTIIPENSGVCVRTDMPRNRASLQTFIKADGVRSRYIDANHLQISLHSVVDAPKKLVFKMKLRRMLVRREEILAEVRNSIREHLEKLVNPSIDEKVDATRGQPVEAINASSAGNSGSTAQEQKEENDATSSENREQGCD